MARYKYPQYVGESSDPMFDCISSPGVPTPHSGIYRCEGCGSEVAANQGNPLPPQNNHQHAPDQGTVRWRLVVYAQ